LELILTPLSFLTNSKPISSSVPEEVDDEADEEDAEESAPSMSRSSLKIQSVDCYSEYIVNRREGAGGKVGTVG
jgi:hypothetical protein